MPALFPTLLPDEPLYSAIARYGDMMDFGSTAAVNRSVFGDAHVTPSIDLPGHIDALLSRLLPGHSYTAEVVLRDHTALPYYGAFLPRGRVSAAGEMLRGTQYRSVGGVLGRNHGRIRVPTRLRVCERCAADDRQGCVGVAYWRRVHQLPGVVVCPIHASPLLESEADPWGRYGPRTYVSAERAITLGSLRPMAVDPARFEVALAIARASLWLLEHGHTVQAAGLATSQALSTRLRAWCGARGWRSRSSAARLRFHELVAYVRESLGDDILAMLGADSVAPGALAPTRTIGTDWIRVVLQRSDRGQPALSALLLLHSIGVQLSDFFSGAPASEISSAVQAGPCGNPACQQHDAHGSLVAPSDRPGTPARVTVRCSACGFWYSDNLGAGRRRLRRVIETGVVWERRLRALATQRSGCNPNFVRELGIGLREIQRHAVRLGVWYSNWGERARARAIAARHTADAHAGRLSASVRRTRDRARAAWLALRAAHPEANRSALIAMNRAAHRALSRTDRVWLEAHLPTARRARSRSGTIAWDERDASVLVAVQAAVEQARAIDQRPIQITVRHVGRRLGRTNTLASWLPRLPRTQAFLRSVVEDEWAFARRRVLWTATRFAAEGVVPSRTSLWYRAALSTRHHRALVDLLDEALDAIRRHVESGADLPTSWALVLSPAPWRLGE